MGYLHLSAGIGWPGAAGGPPVPDTLWSAWSPDPAFGWPLLLAACAYLVGVVRRGRAAGWRSIPAWRPAAFVAGWLVLAVALLSPLDSLTLALLSAHMAQYLLLTTVAPPLLVAGDPLAFGRQAIAPPSSRRLPARAPPWVGTAGAALTRPLVAAALDSAALLAWHFPPLYQAGVRHGALHVLEQASFLGGALLFWWVVEHPRRASTLAAILGTSVLGTGFGFIMFYSATVWYPVHGGTAAAWGLTPREDQQVAAVVLAAPAGTIDVVSFIWALAVWLRREEEETARRERAPLAGREGTAERLG